MGAHRFTLAGLLALFACTFANQGRPLLAQQRERLEKSDAPLVVDGVVRQIFRSPRQGRTDYLLQIDVEKSEGRKPLKKGGLARFPGPGESIYVHLSQRLDASGKALPSEISQAIPEERTAIRAYLTSREQGGWEGAFPEWYEATSERPSATLPDEPAPVALDDLPIPSGKSRLGMSTEVLKVQNKIAIRVTSVERSGPAQTAGLEVGDVIAGIEGEAIKSAGQLEAVAAKGKKFSLIVIDVNNGKGTEIEIDPAATKVVEPESEPSATTDNPSSQPAKISLGISAEPVTLGARSALKVTGVNPESPAGKAGIEVGDIIVAANGAPLTGPEQLLGALRKSGPQLKLSVRDSRTGRDAEVTVNLGGTKPAKPLPSEVETPVNSSPGKLGAVTELAFNDDDFAVKVTEVEAGSAAARAGLKPGIMILAANGKPVLHPNDLNDAIRTTKGPLKLTVLNPSVGKKTNLEIDLGK